MSKEIFLKMPKKKKKRRKKINKDIIMERKMNKVKSMMKRMRMVMV